MRRRRGDWHLVHVASKESSLSINFICLLGAEDSQQIIEDSQSVHRAFASMAVSRSVIANRNELLKSVVDIASRYFEGGRNQKEILSDAHFDISRQFSNMCSMFRSFIDHSDRYMLYRFGKESVEFEVWKNILKEEYDKNLSYKLMYYMRNYIQHYDMPPISINISQSKSKEGLTLNIIFKLANLFEDNFIRRKLSGYVGTKKTIPLINLIKDWENCFFKLERYIENSRRRDSLENARRISTIRDKFEIPDGGSIGVCLLPKNKNKSSVLKLSISWVDEDKADYVLDVEDVMN